MRLRDFSLKTAQMYAYHDPAIVFDSHIGKLKDEIEAGLDMTTFITDNRVDPGLCLKWLAKERFPELYAKYEALCAEWKVKGDAMREALTDMRSDAVDQDTETDAIMLVAHLRDLIQKVTIGDLKYAEFSRKVRKDLPRPIEEHKRASDDEYREQNWKHEGDRNKALRQFWIDHLDAESIEET